MKKILCVVALFACIGTLQADPYKTWREKQDKAPALTRKFGLSDIYSHDYKLPKVQSVLFLYNNQGFVQQKYELGLWPGGQNLELRFLPDLFEFKKESLTVDLENAQVLHMHVPEQSSLEERLLKQALGKEIRYIPKDSTEEQRAILSNFEYGKVFLKTAADLTVKNIEDISIIYPKWMVDSIDTPNVYVKYKTNSNSLFDGEVRTSYLSNKIVWSPTYTAILNEKEQTLEFQSWAVIENKTAAKFNASRINLFSGQLKLNAGADTDRRTGGDDWGSSLETGWDAAEACSENYAFPINGSYSIAPDSTVKIPLMKNKINIPYEKKYIYKALAKENKQKASVQICIANGFNENMPAGPVTFYSAFESDLAILGSARMENLPKGEAAAFYIAKAFDLKVTEEPLKVLSRTSNKITSAYSSKMKIKNTSDEAKTVYVDCPIKVEGEWTLKSKTVYENKDAMNVRFEVNVPAGETSTVEYAVHGNTDAPPAQ